MAVGLYIPGSTVVGPSSGGSADTIGSLLTEWGKSSMWADFKSNVSSFANSDGTGALSDGVKCNRWNQQAGNGFAAYFHNTVAGGGQGMTYKASLHGSPALQGVSDGDQYLDLSSNSILNNIAYSIIICGVLIKEAITTAYVFSNGSNGTTDSVTSSSVGVLTLRSANVIANQSVTHHTHNTPINSTDGESCIGLVAGASSHNNTVVRIGGRNTGVTFSGFGFRRIVIVGSSLTAHQMSQLGDVMISGG